MSDELDYLTEEQKKEVKLIYPEDVKDLESSDDGSHTEPVKEAEKKPDEGTSKAEWKDGYLEYAVKTKESERIQYGEEDIEITEEDLDGSKEI